MRSIEPRNEVRSGIMDKPKPSAGSKWISTPCSQALELVAKKLDEGAPLTICEVGVGIGATSVELCRLLGQTGEIWFFDFQDRLDTLDNKLKEAGYSAFRMCPNSRRTFDSYAWNLAMLVRQRRAAQEGPLFDFVYLDGAHAFQHDAPATICVKELLKVGGYLLMDDYDWTFAISPTANPTVNPRIKDQYTDEQIAEPHVAVVCSLLLDTDPNFERIDIGYTEHEHRRAYRKRRRRRCPRAPRQAARRTTWGVDLALLKAGG